MDFQAPRFHSDYSYPIHSTLLSHPAVISMYSHPHSTHSTAPPDSPGALWYHSSDHPHFLPLCHPPDILVSILCLNSSDLGTSGPWSLIGTSGPLLLQLHLHCLIHSAFP